ncbi:MAG TPA: LysR family transcriptional regulator [Gemmatimonadaceae bacterium]|nr:LysR family transcriptional regulator [Gemmatimonadaceae bacterium]
MALNLHLLRLFVAVAEHGGVVTAARALGVSQPAVSRGVRDLEHQVGIPLLERTPKGVRLTTAGSAVYEHARGVFAAERAVEETMAALRGVERGHLHIGASTTIATYALPEVIAEFTKRHPGVEIRLSAIHTRMIVELLRRYELDVAIAEAPVSDRRIQLHRWRMDEMVVIAAPAHPLAVASAEGSLVPPSALAAERILLREPESGTRTIVLQALSAVGIEPVHTMVVDGTEMIKQLVAGGVGIAIVSRCAVTDALASGRLATIRVDGLSITRPFNRLLLRDRRPSSAARAFLEILDHW